MRITLLSVIIVAIAFFVYPMPSFGEGIMTYVYDAPESPLDRRYDHHWEILKMALERTKDKYGSYRMVPSVFMVEKRQALELKNASGKLTVMYLDTTPEHEKDLIPIRIPIDKNLCGYRVFLIRRDDQPKFNAVQTIGDLRKFTYGLGLGWTDVDILRFNRFKVVTGSNYDGLFEMLINRRFDAFERGVVEVIDEYEERKTKMPDLRIEETILLYYPMPMYFWFSKTEEGKHLATRAQEGLLAMIDDGTFDKLFWKFNGYKIERLKLKSRKMYKIDNPYLVPETPLQDKRLWFDLASY